MIIERRKNKAQTRGALARPGAMSIKLTSKSSAMKWFLTAFNCHTLAQAESVQSKIGAKNREKVAQLPMKAGA